RRQIQRGHQGPGPARGRQALTPLGARPSRPLLLGARPSRPLFRKLGAAGTAALPEFPADIDRPQRREGLDGMASKVIRPPRDDGPRGRGWQSIRESAPSVIRAQQPTGARWVALISLMSAALGAAALVFANLTPPRPYLIGPGWGTMFLTFGIAGLLYHAFVE